MSFAALDGLDWPAFEPGTVWLVGAGPGAPGLLSLLGYHALQRADAVVYDALVSDGLLALANPAAERIHAGKRGGKPSPKQADISLRLIELAKEDLNMAAQYADWLTPGDVKSPEEIANDSGGRASQVSTTRMIS